MQDVDCKMHPDFRDIQMWKYALQLMKYSIVITVINAGWSRCYSGEIFIEGALKSKCTLTLFLVTISKSS